MAETILSKNILEKSILKRNDMHRKVFFFKKTFELCNIDIQMKFWIKNKIFITLLFLKFFPIK